MKAFKVFFGVVKIVLTIVLTIILVFVVAQKISGGKTSMAGYQAYTVITGSMNPEIKVGDIIFIKDVECSTLKIGDIVTYEGDKGDLKGLILTHRIIEKNFDEEDHKYHFVTKGDANDISDPEITEDNIKGKVVYRSVIFSFVSRLMTHASFYYLLFVAISIYFIYQFLAIILSKDDEDEGEKSKA